MAASRQSRPRRRLGRNHLFLVLLSLLYLAGFYACSRPQVARRIVAATEAAVPRTPLTGRAWVVDGDTIRIAGIPIRLEGIDAPEKSQTCTTASGRAWLCGQVATRQLRERIRDQDVTCQPRGLDRYRRVLAICALPNGSDLNAWLVREGWAVASGFTGIYAAEEAEAMTAKRGIWAGSFVAPAEWRRYHR
jgi:endonuclease YncB( thermonuclease family)